MLSLFRTNQLLRSIVFIIYLFLLRGVVLFFPEWFPSESTTAGFLGIKLNALIETFPTSVAWTFTFLLLLGQAIYISYIFSKHRIIMDDILLPGAMYLLAASAIPAFINNHPILVGNTFLIFAFDQLVVTYRKVNSSKHIFNVGFWIAIASLFYFSHIIFLFASFIAISSLRVFNFREILMMLTGVLVVYFLAYTSIFWINELSIFQQQHFAENIAFWNINLSLTLPSIIELTIIGLMLLAVLFSFGRIMRRKTIQFQKRINILYLFLFVTFLTVLFQANINLNHLAILSLPIGLLIGFSLQTMNNSSAEVLHLFFLSIVLIWLLNPLWFSMS